MGKGKQVRNQTIEKEPIPQDGGYGWVILFGCFAISFIVDGIMYNYGIFLPSIADHFGINKNDAPLLTSFYTGFLFCSGPIVSGLSNAFGIRAVVISGAAVLSACLVISIFSPNFYFMCVVYGIIGGISTGCCYLGSLIIVAQYFKKLLGITTGITMSGSGFGSFAIPPLAHYLLNNYEWRFAFIVFACLILQCCVLGALFRPVPMRLKAIESDNKEINEDKEAAPQVEADKDDNTNNNNNNNTDNLTNKFQSNNTIAMFQSKNNLTNNLPVFITREESTNNINIQAFAGSLVSIGNFNMTLNMKTLEGEYKDQAWYERCWEIVVMIVKEITNVKLLFQNFEFFLMTFSNFFSFCGLFIPYIYIPIHADEYNLTSAEKSSLFMIMGIVNIPIRLLFGFLADKKVMTAVNLNTISVAITAASLFCISFLNTFALQAVFCFVYAFGTAGMNCLATPYITDIVGTSRFNNAIGIINLFRGFGCFLGPFVGGQIGKALGGYLYVFWFAAVAFSLSCLCSLTVGLIDKFKRLCCKKEKVNEKELVALQANKA